MRLTRWSSALRQRGRYTESHTCRDRWCRTFMDMEGWGGPQGGYGRSGSEWECGWKRGTGFLALMEYRAHSPRMQSRTREAQPTQYGGLFGMDETGGLFGMPGSLFWGRSVMFQSPGQSGRPTLQANAVRGPSPLPRPRSRPVSPSRGGEVPICRREVEGLRREGDTNATGKGEVGMVRYAFLPLLTP